MTDSNRCIRRVTASYRDNNPPRELPSVCARSICSEPLCAKQMNSGDRNECRICIYGTDNNQIIMNEKAEKIATSWFSTPELMPCRTYASYDQLTASFKNACSNYSCTQTLTNLCDNERKNGSKQCGTCVGGIQKNAEAAKNAGCSPEEITNWCSDQSSKYACNPTGYCSADPQGPYTDLTACNKACKYKGKKFTCDSRYKLCMIDSLGEYSDLDKCRAACSHSE